MARPDTIEVDIATRIVAPDEDFYVIRPGEKYSLYNEFVDRKAVFLDFPDLDLQAFAAAKPGSELRRELALRSQTIREYHRGKGKKQSPSRNIDDYKGKAYRAKLGKHISAIEKLYLQLGDGTIIIVPAPGPYANVFIGVLDGSVESFKDFDLYPNEVLYGRRVRWLGQRAKAGFTPAARERLTNPQPLMQLDRKLREEFLRVAYDQFIIDDQFTARLRNEADDFSSIDNEDITTFVNYVAGLIAYSEERANAKNVSAEEAVDLLREMRDRVPELSVVINSPGFLRLLSTRVDPVTIAAFMAIAMSGASPVSGQTVQISNSAGVSHDSCTLKVSQQASGIMGMMDFDDFQLHCKRLNEAAKNVKLKSSMEVRKKDGKP